MIKVNYPIGKKERREFEDTYFKLLKDQEVDFNKKINKLPNNLINFFNAINYKQIIVGRIDKLVQIYNQFLNLPTQQDKDDVKALFEKIFSYDQPKISRFFEKHNHIFNLKACYYCNVDSVHVYSSLGGYFNELDFIRYATSKELCDIYDIGKVTAQKVVQTPNRKQLTLASLPKCAKKVYDRIKGYNVIILGYADNNDFALKTSIKELLKVPGIGDATAKKIIANRLEPDFFDKTEVKKLCDILSGFKGINRNHFTLDHYIPQSSCCLFARSLYNFVPSCYVCNSKLKKEELLSDKSSALHTCSPTHKNYDSTGNLKFSLIQKSNVNIFDYNKSTDRKQFLENFEIDIESPNTNNRIVSVLHLKQRYSLYKDKAVYLAYLKEKYSPQSLEEIAKILSQNIQGKVTANDVKNDIFNDPLYENESFSKLHKDIKIQIGIKIRK